MYGKNKVKVFVNSLLLHPKIQKLKMVDDKGITVSAHTYDVLRIAIKKIKKDYTEDIETASDELDFFSMVIGVIIHDTTKATLRLNGSKLSHSVVMRKHPDIVEKEAADIINDVENFTKLTIKKDAFDHILHIVLSHHGKWGKFIPTSREAKIVHEADKYSAMYHRITPIGGKKIVKLLSEGFDKEEVAKITGYTEGIINDRLKRSKKELNFKSNRELVSHYRANGAIPDGDRFFSRRIRETEKLIKKVENIGFEELIMKNILIDYIFMDDVFE